MKPESGNSKVGRRAFFGAWIGVGGAVVKTAAARSEAHVLIPVLPHCPNDESAMAWLRPTADPFGLPWRSGFGEKWIAKCYRCGYEVESTRFVQAPEA